MVGFGKRIGDGTTEAVSRLTDVGVGGSLELSEARVARALAKLAEGSYGVVRRLRRADRAGPARRRARERALHRVRAPRALGTTAPRGAEPHRTRRTRHGPAAVSRDRGGVATPQSRDDGGVVAVDEGDAHRR